MNAKLSYAKVLRMFAKTLKIAELLFFGGGMLSVTISCRHNPADPVSRDAVVDPSLPDLLVDMTSESQVDFSYRNGEESDRFSILESVGGGVALLDYDRDGRLDLFMTGGGTFDVQDPFLIHGLPSRLYRNLGQWRFADVTADAGLLAAPFYSHGCLASDFNNDGWQDLLVTGFGGIILYHNRPRDAGGRHFVDVTAEVGLTDTRWCTSAAAGDLMGNGRTDLYVCRYLDWSTANDPKCTPSQGSQPRDICPPQRFEALSDSIYQNEGAMFRDATESVGLSQGKGLGVVLSDLNGDARPDLYVANDDGVNFLYVNQGAGMLSEQAAVTGVAVDDHGRYNGSMGVAADDFDGDGRCSLLVTNYQGELPALYANLSPAAFLHQSQVAGLGAAGQSFVGFGVSFLDLENDGWLDLAIANGHVLRYPVGAPFLQRALLFRNVNFHGRRFFREISSQGGSYFATPTMGRGLAVGDLDNDGRTDLVISHSNRPVTLLRNAGQDVNAAHWLGLELVGRDNRPIAGAVVQLRFTNRELTRYTKSGGSYLSSSDPRVLFGLGTAARVDLAVVHWPWGDVQQWDLTEFSVDKYWRLEEGVAVPLSAR